MSRPALAVWPVIHLDTIELALSNAAIAAAHGCAGVFLISMDGRDHLIKEAAEAIRAEHPQLALGANFLTLRADAALARSLAARFAATWTDKPGVRSDGISGMAGGLRAVLDAHPGHFFFASVAFKYQPVDLDPPTAARLAADLGMIPTTSGAATGQAPPAAKLAAMRAVVPQLALASGATPENIDALAPHLTHLLVSTGISKSFHAFDDAKLGRLMSRAG